jgi:fumarylacetoacetate (FAA) hydrolase
MKLATLKGNRDGAAGGCQPRDLGHYQKVPKIAATLQFCARSLGLVVRRLAAKYSNLNDGSSWDVAIRRSAARRCHQWADGSTYINADRTGAAVRSTAPVPTLVLHRR